MMLWKVTVKTIRIGENVDIRRREVREKKKERKVRISI